MYAGSAPLQPVFKLSFWVIASKRFWENNECVSCTDSQCLVLLCCSAELCDNSVKQDSHSVFAIIGFIQISSLLHLHSLMMVDMFLTNQTMICSPIYLTCEKFLGTVLVSFGYKTLEIYSAFVRFPLLTKMKAEPKWKQDSQRGMLRPSVLYLPPTLFLSIPFFLSPN